VEKIYENEEGAEADEATDDEGVAPPPLVDHCEEVVDAGYGA
jgi:hypothetical protein